MTTPMTKIREWRGEFLKKFTVWNDKYKLATLNGVEEYPTPDDIADWWINRFQQELSSLEGEIGNLEDWIFSSEKCRQEVLKIIRQHKEG